MRSLAVAAALLLVLIAPGMARGPAGPIDASLFGEWVGGIVPPPVTLGARECLSQPMVIFTRDSVLRALMTSPTYEQRAIEGVSATAAGFELQLTPAPGGQGFGCPNPDVLPVRRRGDNEIVFPGCSAFPFPLVRCATH